jgi:hypothetical protein
MAHRLAPPRNAAALTLSSVPNRICTNSPSPRSTSPLRVGNSGDSVSPTVLRAAISVFSR